MLYSSTHMATVGVKGLMFALLPGVGGVESRDPGNRELSKLSTFDADAPALLYKQTFYQLVIVKLYHYQ